MKKFALLVVSLFAAGSALYARKPAPVIPDFIHAAYSVESLLSEAELTNPGYDAFQFIYLMATPEWAGLDFDRPQDAVDAYATQFDYLKQGGKMALAPSMIEKAHAAGARILLCFGGQQEFLPLLENPDRIAKFVGYMVRLVEKNGYDGIDMDWEITLDKELHARMMALLRERFDELSERTVRYYYLTTALSIDHEYDRALADRLAGAVDWINIMSYDMCDGVWGSTPSHNTSMERMRSKLEHWKVFDKRKLCLGLANYGFYYKGLKPGQKADGPLRDYGSYITYKEFLPRLANGWTEEYDPAAEVSYYFSPDRTEFVTIDNPSSIRSKIEWIKAGGYLGAFWWEFHHDYVAPGAENPQGSHYLIDIVTRYLGRK